MGRFESRHPRQIPGSRRRDHHGLFMQWTDWLREPILLSNSASSGTEECRQLRCHHYSIPAGRFLVAAGDWHPLLRAHKKDRV